MKIWNVKWGDLKESKGIGTQIVHDIVAQVTMATLVKMHLAFVNNGVTWVRMLSHQYVQFSIMATIGKFC